MFFSDKDIASWKEDVKSQDNNRKNGQFGSEKVQYTKPVTWRDVKQKELEYHPILQKYAVSEKENNQKVQEQVSWQKRADVAKKHVEKYAIDYNIINLEKDSSIPARAEKDITAGRLMPKAQVDYNIINNNRLDDIFLKNFHPDAKKTSQGSPRLKGKTRDFNIISNKYYVDHDHKTTKDSIKINEEWKNKFNKTHDYNPILAEFYDNDKEVAFLDKREKDAAEHGKSKLENLPPTIKNREMIIFDPTREVPEAIKVLDQKKKDAMKKYELRYKVEDQLRERDVEFQNKSEQMKLNRVNDRKFAEVYDKGFDMITLNDYTKDNMNFVPKPTQTKWEKIKVNANPVQTLNSNASGGARPALSANDLKEARPQVDVNSGYKTSNASGWTNTMKSGSVGGYEVLRGKLEDDSTTRNDPFTIREFKSAAQRAKEPVYNLADQYNQYCVPPKRVMDDFNTRTLPQIKVPDTTLKFSLSKTGGFKKGESVA